MTLWCKHQLSNPYFSCQAAAERLGVTRWTAQPACSPSPQAPSQQFTT